MRQQHNEPLFCSSARADSPHALTLAGVVQTVLERIDRWAPESKGAQNKPRTTVVIDEANLAMPNADPDAGASGVVQSLLRATPAHPAHCTREHMGDRKHVATLRRLPARQWRRGLARHAEPKRREPGHP